jgi:N-acylneuraminate cytidylyltransferase
VTKIFAIIPARGGSKRIPNKNIQLANGKPLIAFPILTAISSGFFEEVIVSTDSEKIASISRAFGASTPFLRDADLSDDYTPTIPVIRDALNRLPQIGAEDIVCCIYPTSIFLTNTMLSEAIEITSRLSSQNFIVSYTTFPYPIQRALRKDLAGTLNFFEAKNALARSQDLEPAYHDAAQFYFARRVAWETQNSVFTDSIGVEIPRRYVQDIDTFEDLENARLILNMLNKS